MPPFSSLGPVAVRTTLPSRSKSKQVSPGYLPPPIRKFRHFRSTLNAGEVSVPTAASPPTKLLAKPLPAYPLTVIWPGSVPRAGRVPKAVPSARHPAQSVPSKSATTRSGRSAGGTSAADSDHAESQHVR